MTYAYTKHTSLAAVDKAAHRKGLLHFHLPTGKYIDVHIKGNWYGFMRNPSNGRIQFRALLRR